MKGFWRGLKSPSRMAAGVLLLIGAIGGVIIWGGFNTFMEHTNSLGFCTGCHEMDIVHAEYQRSVHYENTSGVRAICSDCHVPKPWTPKLLRKIKATNEIYHKLMGSIDTPEKFEAKRLELAANVWRSMKETDSRECRNCHAYKTMTTSSQSNDARFWHPMAVDEGFTCIDCHKGIAHQMPDLDQFVKEASERLTASLAAEKRQSGRLYTAEEKPLRGSPDESAQILARIAAGASLTVIEPGQGGWIKISLDGYEALNSASRLFLNRDKGVVVAAVAGPLEYIGEQPVVDPQTRLSWRSARISGWIKDDMLAANAETLWSYAKTLYEYECARCHALFPPSRFKAPAWVNSMRNMQRFTQLSGRESDLVSAYLQRNGKGLADF